MYKDDFLPECAAELWCLNLNAYYRSLYLRLCRNARRQSDAAKTPAGAG